ncbi:phage tail protein [Hymenobacter monticola]|uniref:Tail fiber protein n=1 Tax=Hymenobacter monticola TaxID=1705399 RepID=A0ABY4AZ11_9BACT|nr:tail fiber protein [Hymenobacter monticola]UOE32137.1 tail fiber protein [Hymenobacter monticola]
MENFLGELRLMSFPRAPKGWAFCQGQLLQINQNNALFSLIGTSFGGDGRTTFGLPDLRGRTLVGQGKAPSGTGYTMGQVNGQEQVALSGEQMPAHKHTLSATLNVGGDADTATPRDSYPATATDPANNAYTTGGTPVLMGAALGSPVLQAAGASQPHTNQQPYLTLNYAIALTGIFPSRG